MQSFGTERGQGGQSRFLDTGGNAVAMDTANARTAGSDMDISSIFSAVDTRSKEFATSGPSTMVIVKSMSTMHTFVDKIVRAASGSLSSTLISPKRARRRFAQQTMPKAPNERGS
jgi:hypothetical protein